MIKILVIRSDLIMFFIKSHYEIARQNIRQYKIQFEHFLK